jgi:Flp pilus assembly protein CpaB
LILVGAILIGVIAALLIYNYVQGINTRAQNNAKLVDVYKAEADIARGTPGETVQNNHSVQQAQIPQEFRPNTAITTLDQLSNKVALFDIPKNSVIITDMFVDPATAQISFRDRITKPNYVALSISTDTIHGVGGFLVPGDEVNMTVDVNCESNGQANACKQGATAADGSLDIKTVPMFLYQKVYILAVGSQTVLQPGETASTTQNGGSGGVLTVEVPVEATPWIELGQESGTLYLSLVTQDYVPKVVPPIPFTGAKLPGQDGSQITPYGPSGKSGLQS